MLERIQLFPLNFYKKERFHGSMGKMNFRLEKSEREKEDGERETILLATVWEGPFCYDAADKDQMESKSFPFSEEGISQAMDWFNEKGKAYDK